VYTRTTLDLSSVDQLLALAATAEAHAAEIVASRLIPAAWQFRRQACRGKKFTTNPAHVCGLVAVLNKLFEQQHAFVSDLERLFVDAANDFIIKVKDRWPLEADTVQLVPCAKRAELRFTLINHLAVVQLAMPAVRRVAGGGRAVELIWMSDPGPRCPDAMLVKLVTGVLSRTSDLPRPARETTATEINLIKAALTGEHRQIVDMLVTACVDRDRAIELGIPVGRQRNVTAAYDKLVTATLPELWEKAHADATGRAALHAFRKLVLDGRVLKNERHAAAVALKDILARVPNIVDVLRQAASSLGCKSKKGTGMGTPVDQSIFERDGKIKSILPLLVVR
jgi:hypothetical protein